MRELSRRNALRLLTHAGMPWVCVPGEIRWHSLNVRTVHEWRKDLDGEPQYTTVRRIDQHHVPDRHFESETLYTIARYSWDGEKLFIPPTRDSWEITHELAHWLVATPDRRKRPEFRLGPAPWEDVDRLSQDYSWLKSGDTDEQMTCVVQIGIYHALGLPWRGVADRLNSPIRRSWLSFLRASDETDAADVRTPGYWFRRARKRMGRHPLAWLKGFSL